MNCQMFSLRSWALLAGLITMGLTGMVAAQQGSVILTVCPDKSSGCQYTSVQEAVDAAKSGDAIQIAPGTYETKDKTIIISAKKGLTLQGMGQKPEETVLKGDGQRSVLKIENAEAVTMENLMVREGNGGVENVPSGGGIHIEKSSSITLKNIIVTENKRAGLLARNVKDLKLEAVQALANIRSESGRGQAGILIYASTGQIMKAVVRDNQSDGIWIRDFADEPSSVTLSQSVIESNLELGLLVDDTSIVQLSENQILNTRDGEFPSYGLYIHGEAQVTMEKNLIRGNNLGIVMVEDVKVVLRENTITKNKNWGVIMGFEEVQGESIQAEFVNNTISEHRGCGLYIDGDERIQIKGSGNKLSSNRGGNICGPGASKVPPGF